MKVVIAGGGTAGHVNPALALAACMGGDEVSFLGTNKGAEAKLVPEAGYPLHEIEVRGFDRAKPLSFFATAARAGGAVATARTLLRRIRPDVLLGMGGYVSLPACIAARTMRIPVVLHEQNIVFGLANRVSKPLARTIGVSFEETLSAAGGKGVFTGNPVAPELVGLDRGMAKARAQDRWELDPERRTLLVFGGSLGAKRVNDAAAGLAARWADRSDLQVLHITGRSSYEAISRSVSAARPGRLIYRVVDYVSGMGDAYAAADLALCRGGATTVAELGVLGVPSVIVPYPHHRDRQQEKHAGVLVAAGAARLLDDAQTTTETVGTACGGLLAEDAALTSMAAAALALGRPDAGDRLAAVIRKAAS